jgi:cytosine deaminase
VPTYDLLVTNARVRGYEQLCTVAVAAGLIAAIDEAGAEATTILDAEGQLVSPSFVDAHLHLDKVYTFERAGDAALREYTGAAMGGAMTSIELASR